MRLITPLAVLTCSIAAVLAAPSALADDAAAAARAPRIDDAWRIEFGADAWFPRLLGDVTSPSGVTRDIKLLDLRDSEVAFDGHATISRGRCFAELSGFSFDTKGEYSSGGDAFRSDFAWWGVSADVGYALFTPFADESNPWGDASFDRYGGNVNDDGSYRLDLRLSPTLGVSYHDIQLDDLNVTQSVLSATDGGWMSARVGADLELRLRPGADFSFLKEIIIGAEVSAGPMFGVSGDAGGAGLAIELEADGKLMFTENIGANIGYRLVDSEFKSDGSASDLGIGLYGLFAGVSIRF